MSTSELVSKSEEGLPKRSLNQRLLDAVFGFDYFISYRWDDAQAYAAALARALRRRGFTVFLDRKEMGVGENWMFAVHYALKRTTRLVLIGSPLVHDSKAVEDELRVFTGAGKKIIPISFGGSLDSEGLSQSPLRPYLLKTLLRAEEPPDALRKGEPSLEIVRQLTISFHQERQTEKRTRLLLMFLAVLGLLLAATVGGATWAVRERNRAVQKNIELQHSFSIADFQRATSDLSQNDWESGTAHLTRALSRDAANAAAAQRLYSILAYEPYFALTDSFSPPGNRFKTLDASADGRRLLAVATNGTAWLWLSGRPPEQLNITNVLSASLTQDGDTVVVMTRDALVRWDVKSGSATRVATLDQPRDLAVSPSGHFAVVTSEKSRSTATIYQPLAPKPRPSRIKLTNEIETVSFEGREDKVVLYHREDFTVWNLLRNFAEPADFPWERADLARFSADGSLTYKADYSPSLGETPFDELVGLMDTRFDNDDVVDLAISANGKVAVVVLASDQAAILETNTDSQILVSHPGVNGVHIVDSRECFVTFGGNGQVRIYSLSSGTLLFHPLNTGAPITSVCVSTNGKLISALSEDGCVTRWREIDADITMQTNVLDKNFVSVSREQTRTQDGGELKERGSNEGVWMFKQNPQAKEVVVAEHPIEKSLRKDFDFPAPTTLGIVDRSGENVLTAAGEDAPQIWNIRTGAKLPLATNTPSGYVRDIRFSEDGKTIFVGYGGLQEPALHSIALYRTEDGQVITNAQLRSGDAVQDFSHDFEQALVPNKNTARVYRTKEWNAVGQPAIHTNRVLLARFVGDGSSFITFDRGGEWRVWDTETGLPSSPWFDFDPAPPKEQDPRDDDYTSVFWDGGPVKIAASGSKVAVRPPNVQSKDEKSPYRIWEVRPAAAEINELVACAEKLFGASMNEAGAISTQRPTMVRTLRQRFDSNADPAMKALARRLEEE